MEDRTGTYSLKDYINNTSAEVLHHLGHRLILKSEYTKNECFIYSPINYYTKYPLQALKKIKEPFIKYILISLCRLLYYYLKRNHIDKVVFIDHDLYTISSYQHLCDDQFKPLMQYLISSFPQHTIMIYGLNEKVDAKILQEIKNYNFQLIPSKPVHMYDIEKENYLKKINLKRDLKLLSHSKIIEIKPNELHFAALIQKLYHKLYIEKHSVYNPDYTVHFFEKCIAKPDFKFFVLVNDKDEIIGFNSFRIRDKYALSGPVGYDPTGKAKGIFRTLFAIPLKYCEQHNLIYNYGGGAGNFKTIRGSQKVMEYNAIYIQHLPKKKQRVWRLLTYILDTAGKKAFRNEAF